MNLGDKVRRTMHLYDGAGSGMQTVTGTVIYIHPRQRYYIVEFPMPRGEVIREAYYWKGD